MRDSRRQAAHDLRSPLATIRFLAENAAFGEEERLLLREALRRAEEIAARLEGARAPSFEPVRISGLLREIAEEKRARFPAVKFLLSARPRLFARADAPAIRRALSNLVDNALEALPESGGKISITARKHGGLVRIRVRDNGHGIPRARLAQLGKKGVSFRTGGSGLGLFQAKRAAAASRGTLALRSRAGAGTAAELTLPASPCPAWFLGSRSLKWASVIVADANGIAVHARAGRWISARPLARAPTIEAAAAWLACSRLSVLRLGPGHGLSPGEVIPLAELHIS